MIISRTPFRISFFGGGTDYPTWVEKHGGAVLSTTFDKYNYITCRWLPPFFDHKYRIAYSRLERVLNPLEIEHPAIRAVLNNYESELGMEIHCDDDLPSRSGLGSSSSFMVGLLHALEALNGRRASPKWLAREAIRYEQSVLGDNVGSQDQVAAAFGGLNIIHFRPDGNFKVEPLILSQERKRDFGRYLMLFFTGFSRIASEIAKSQIDNMDQKERTLHSMRGMVDEGVEILSSEADLRTFGELLHDAWVKKRSLSDKISMESLDAIYDQARKHGAIGGKLLGAGGGGFMLFFVEPDKQESVRQALANLIYVPFKFESDGAQIVYYRV
ncbi:MAG: kinase [Desulfovibrio sp.]|jgi:D-glycero-alpha-D-manno-heptose-7-phosphate kinase|nr:kinase [Desulfovibrio sp.]